MKSKAALQSHPIHPMLIVFPIAFLIGSLAFDLATILGIGAYFQIASTLSIVGVWTALIAAVPGAVDLFNIVPPNSSGRRRGLQHMGINVLAVTLFLASWLARDGMNSTGLSLILSLAGTACLSIGGWLGGTLVYRNQIGVDHRYASAGKWREKALQAARGAWVRVGEDSELKSNQMMLVTLNGVRIAVGRGPSGYFAFSDRCTHKGGPLADGTLVEGVVQCPWHGSQFDALTGAVKSGPARQRIETWEVRIDNGSIMLRNEPSVIDPSERKVVHL